MSHSQHPQRPVFRFRNPLRIIFPKGAKIPSLLNAFENTLAGRIAKLQPAGKDDALQLSWLTCAVEQLCEVNTDVKTLIKDLDLPASDWKGKWIKMHLDSGAKLLDIFNSFTAHIGVLEQGHRHLLCALRCLDGTVPETYVSACSSLDKWRRHINSHSPSLDQCFFSMNGLSQNLDQPKGTNSKEKALMRAMYGVEVFTLFVCGAFAASLVGGSAEKLKDFQVPDRYLWARDFVVLQTRVNEKIRKRFASGRVTVLKELEAIDVGVEKLYPIVRERAPAEAEFLMNVTSDIRKSSDEYSQGLDLLSKKVRKFFNVLMSERNSWLLTQ